MERIPGASVLRRALRDRSVRSALFAFGLTRALVFVVFVLATHFFIVGGPKPMGEFQEPVIELHGRTIVQRLRQLALRGDGGWYVGTAKEGYEHRPFDATEQHNWAFFPLYPLSLRAASTLTGGLLLTGMLLSNLFFLPALVLLHKTALAFGLDEGDADRAVFYLAAFPTAYFFSVAQTESLFLLLTVGSFYAATRDRWWLAGAVGALASATRFSGIFLVPALAVLYWQRHGFRLRANLLGLGLVPLGLLSFMIYLHLITGNAFAFKDVLVAWGRTSGFFLSTLFSYLARFRVVSESWNFGLLNFAAAVLALACGIVLARRREWSLSLYTLLSIIAPLSSTLLQSHARYALTIFPVFMLLAQWGRSPLVDQTIRAIFIILLGLMSALFAAHFTIAMS
ncbi:MAG: mannosyltransferase family protein [Pyrinomonadaceae bacterium]